MTEEKQTSETPEKKNPFREIVQPFIDLVHAPRALWGINLPYLLEGMCYFGVLGYLAMYFNEYVGLNDVQAGIMVGVLTWGITFAMFLFGGLADRWGVRVALIAALALMLVGRICLAGGPTFGLDPEGLRSPIHLVAMFGILLVVLGYGMFQPAAYAAVRLFTNPKTAAMGFAMLYALMNLGGWLPTFFSPIRNAIGISGAVWVYAAITAIALLCTITILSKKTVQKAIDRAKAETLALSNGKPDQGEAKKAAEEPKLTLGKRYWFLNASQLFLSVTAILLLVFGIISSIGLMLKREYFWGTSLIALFSSFLGFFLLMGLVDLLQIFKDMRFSLAKDPEGERSDNPRRVVWQWLKQHPLTNLKFSFFIFALIPVQTLFAHNWLTLPMYVERGFRETWPWISRNFEPAVNFNPLLIFIFVPIVTALTYKKKAYNMMIIGTFIMAAPTFFLAVGPYKWTLVSYLLIMTVGEAMWQPRFLQYAAEIAPEGKTGAYMGVAQFPWFLTKVITSFYSGWFLTQYCPDDEALAAGVGSMNTQKMWFIYGCIAICSTVLLLLAKGWIGKDFKEKA